MPFNVLERNLSQAQDLLLSSAGLTDLVQSALTRLVWAELEVSRPAYGVVQPLLWP